MVGIYLNKYNYKKKVKYLLVLENKPVAFRSKSKRATTTPYNGSKFGKSIKSITNAF